MKNARGHVFLQTNKTLTNFMELIFISSNSDTTRFRCLNQRSNAIKHHDHGIDQTHSCETNKKIAIT